ncbi:hypothetical protein DH2020_011945 [Rehmannia glutinosa]|uniref:Mediator of RNA polymerase II transcription subunit 25 n=1 Tax=Rehmannia glutinosa TaxID=99300 RepID=A0ABR0XEX7_REHGL
MVPKQLIVAVEGTAAIGPFWQTIVSDYLDKIIRCFCGNESLGQKPTTSQVELSLVMFNAHGSYSDVNSMILFHAVLCDILLTSLWGANINFKACLVQRSGWTKDMDIFFQWLSAIPLAGGGFNDAAIAEGLAEALTVCDVLFPSGNQNQNVDGQRHCILVAASNPYPLPTPVYRPQPQNIEQSENIETQPDNRLSDAEALAKSFAQCAISLSVICPKKLPKLRAIYNAGKRNPRAADPPVDNVKNPHFLVLISENFMEARAALNRSGMTNLPSNQNPIKVDVTPVPAISTPPPASVPSELKAVIFANNNKGLAYAENVLCEEPTTVTPATGPAFPQMSSVPRATSQAVPTLQTSSPISMSQEMTPNNENVQDMKPLAPTLRPVGGAAANVRFLNDVAQALPPVQTVVSSGITSIAGSLPIPTSAQVAQNSASASFTSTASNVTGNSSIGMSQSLSNLQASVSMGQTLPSMSQGSLPVPQMVQTGMGMNQNMMNATGSSGMPSGTGTMMPTPGMSQQMQPGMQGVGMNSNNSVTNMPLNQQTSSTIQSAQSKYVKVWEGNLSGQRQGQPVFITRLEGYRSASASETLAANWPQTMQIVRLISQDHMNNKQYVGKADFLVFRAMDQHGFLGQLQEKKLLPSQTLLLSVSDKAYRLIGMLFPGLSD